MKHPVWTASICIGIFVFAIVFIERSSAQNRQDNPPSPEAQDREMAEIIKRLTIRSTDGLVEELLADGGYSIDLKGQFQSVVVGMLDNDGDVAVRCVASLEETNSFLGRNLETGESLPEEQRTRHEKAKPSERHQMTAAEIDFIKNMIEEAARSRRAYPEAATLTIVNNDGAGEGFNDATPAAPIGGNNGATLGAQRLNLFNFAAGIWGAFLDSNVPIQVRAQFDPQTCAMNSAVLGTAGPTSVHRDFPNAGFAGTAYAQALANKQRGLDLSAANPDINTTFNSNVNGDPACLNGRTFYLGFDNTAPAGTTNLLVVLLHELGHGLGFLTFANTQTGAFSAGFPDTYTTFMFDRTTGMFWNDMTNPERAASAINPNNVLWDGLNVKAASGFLTAGRDVTNGRVELFTPNPLQGGSSVSHFSTASFPNLLMEPSINLGLPIDLDLTRQQMRDIGWYRDTNADLIPDTITNVVPSAGSLVVGTNANITWTNGGGFARNVIVELSTDGGTTFPTTLATNMTNIGTLAFTIPNMPTTTGRIRVREHNFTSPSGMSAANIIIAGAAPTTVSGVVSYGTTAVGQPPKFVPGVLLTGAGLIPVSASAGAAGAYSLSGFGAGNYTVAPTKLGDVNGISALDAARVAQHAAGLIVLTSNQQLAGDATNNGTLSALDASRIAQTAAGITNPGITGQWKFVPASRTYPSVPSSISNENYEAILVGDVTANWTPPAARTIDDKGSAIWNMVDPVNWDTLLGKRSAKPDVVDVHLPVDASAPPGTVVTVPISIADTTGKDVVAYEFTLNFDPNILSPTLDPASTAGTISEGWSVMVNLEVPGQITFTAYSTQELIGPGNLLNLNFTVIGASSAPTPLKWTRFVFNENEVLSIRNSIY